MNASSRHSGLLLALSIATGATALFASAGCEKEKPAAVAEDAGAGDNRPNKAQLSGKFGAAVAAAASGQAPSAAAASAANGPPESGIFAPGAADVTQPPAAPPKVELINDGAEPRFQLAYAPSGDEQRIVIQVSARLGQGGGLPNIDFALSMKTDKAGLTTATVVSATPGKEIAAQLPKDFAAAVGKLKGTEIRFTLGPDGVMSAPAFTLSKDADAGLEIAVRGLIEAMTLMEAPLPKKPVGAGGYWMVTDRSSTFGIEVVRYRVFKVQKVEKDHGTFAVDVRQYAVKGTNDLGGQQATFEHFESSGKGNTEWAPSAFFTPGSELNQRMRGQINTGKAGQMAMLQTELTGATAPATDDKGTKKK